MMPLFGQMERRITEPWIIRTLFTNPKAALIYLPLRLWLGWSWIDAARHKIDSPAWMETGDALKGFWTGAVNVPDDERPAIASGWYREIISALLDSGSYVWFAKLVAIGELPVGIALILGAFMAITAAAGAFMNLDFIMAGSASTNGLLLLVGWRISGYLGFDGLLMARIPMPWNRPAEDPEASKETVEAPA